MRDHVDAHLVTRAQDALGAWLETRVSSPTSQLSGGGAVGRAESRLSALLHDRPVILTPSASYALWVALRMMGVGRGDEVLLPSLDWSAGLAAVRAVGAVPVVVPVDPATLTIDPAKAAALRTARTKAVIATHLFGVPADVPALRQALPWVPLIEDCAQAFGSTLDGQPVGTFGDLAVFSFGPGKRIDSGELGALVLRDDALWETAIRMSTHPVRQRHSGIAEPELGWLSIRPHPLAAIMLAVALEQDEPSTLIEARRRLAQRLRGSTGIRLVGVDDRRRVATTSIPIATDGIDLPPVSDDLTVRYADVLDIDSVLDGRTISRRFALVADAMRHEGRR